MNDQQRSRMAAAMDLLVANAGRVHYPRGDRRVESVHHVCTLSHLRQLVQRPGGLTIDCSQSCELLLNIGLGRKWHPEPYDADTGLFYDRLPHHYRDPAAAFIGAPVVWGHGSRSFPRGHHMGAVRFRGADPWIFSQGKESPDPHYVRLSVESRYQPQPVDFCSIARLG